MMQSQPEPVIRIRDLRFGWPGGRLLLDLPEFELGSGERVFVQGPSGSGKSTFLALVAGIHVPDSGHIQLLGEDLGSLSAGARDRLRGREVGLVFQQFNLIGYLSVLDNVLLPLTFSAERRRRTGRDQGDCHAAATRLLRALGLGDDVSARAAARLSVGQQQRVAVARALLGSPRLIVCDEPTSALDADARDGFLDVLIEQCEVSKAALLFVSHDRALADHFQRQLDLGQLAADQR